jgi:methoxymalonate biosynthesis acyl carrier protein
MKLADELWKYIQKNFLTGECPEGFSRDEDLIDNGVLDSLSTLNLVSYLEEEYGIKIKSEDITVENFGTVDQMAAMIEHKKTGLP